MSSYFATRYHPQSETFDPQSETFDRENLYVRAIGRGRAVGPGRRVNSFPGYTYYQHPSAEKGR